jgi:hypothetical protein
MKDLKNILIGFLLGVVLMLALGAAGDSGKADFGFAVPQGGFAVIKSRNGSGYVINERGERKNINRPTDSPDPYAMELP